MSDEKDRAKEDDRPEIVFDGDSYFFEIISEEKKAEKETIINALASVDPSLSDLQLLYYLEARSAMVPAGTHHEDMLRDAMREWQETCLGSSALLTYLHLKRQSAISPSWLNIYIPPILRVLEGEYPEARNIEIDISMESRLQARSVSVQRIKISPLTRIFLRHYNLIIWNHIEAETLAGQGLFSSPDIQSVARLILPYLIHCYGRCIVARLPYSGVSRATLLGPVLMTTMLQMMFVLAHEYGHVLLGHLGQIGRSQQQKLQLEREADQFAFKTLLRVIEQEKIGSIGDLWTAVRWLHQYFLLDKTVGSILSGELLVAEDPAFEQRKNDMLSLLPKEQLSSGDNMLESRGVIILISLKHALIELGKEFLEALADELTSPLQGANATWWVKIRNSEIYVSTNNDATPKVDRRKQ